VPVSSSARSVTGPNGSLRGGSPLERDRRYAQVKYVSGLTGGGDGKDLAGLGPAGHPGSLASLQ